MTGRGYPVDGTYILFIGIHTLFLIVDDTGYVWCRVFFVQGIYMCVCIYTHLSPYRVCMVQGTLCTGGMYMCVCMYTHICRPTLFIAQGMYGEGYLSYRVGYMGGGVVWCGVCEWVWICYKRERERQIETDRQTGR